MDGTTTEETESVRTGRKRKSRGKGLRTRTGCQSCRLRRVKCDETHPACRACQRAGRECEYASQDGNSAAENVDGSAQLSLVQQPASANSDLQDASISQEHDPLVTGASVFIGPSPGVLAGSLDTSGLERPSITHDGHETQAMDDGDAITTSPDSTWSGWANLSAEAASLSWFGLLATDATDESFAVPQPLLTPGLSRPVPETAEGHAQLYIASGRATPQIDSTDLTVYTSQDDVKLSDDECELFQHFVRHLSEWIDITDPDRCFAVVVPHMALRNKGLMNAILALAARHLSMSRASGSNDSAGQLNRTSAVQYYYETLKYLQREMGSAAFLRSDELLATVLIISTYEMIDGSARGWERHLKGVFWIQRSQLIHGESEGLKKRIWWAWLRQDLWVAFRERRKILSYYRLSRSCASLDFWELVDRAVWLLGQCVNYASLKEVNAGNMNVQKRLSTSSELWNSLSEWYSLFERHDRRLPTGATEKDLFQPIWINPSQASLAIQVHCFSKLLLLEFTPAVGGLKELIERQKAVQVSVETICGIACCTEKDGATIVSTLCTIAAGPYVKEPGKRRQVIDLLRKHRERTGWPPYDLGDELRCRWIADDE